MTKPVLLDKTSDGGTAACTAERPKVAARQGKRSTRIVTFERKGAPGGSSSSDGVLGSVACALSILYSVE